MRAQGRRSRLAARATAVIRYGSTRPSRPGAAPPRGGRLSGVRRCPAAVRSPDTRVMARLGGETTSSGRYRGNRMRSDAAPTTGVLGRSSTLDWASVGHRCHHDPHPSSP